MLLNRSIICFGGEDWWYHHPHSKNHIMRRLARAGNRVMFVNSISMGLPSVRSADFFAKIRRKLKSYAKFVRRSPEGIVVVTPIVTPFYGSAFGRALNRLLLVLQIRLLMLLYGFGRTVLWVAIPTAKDVVGHLREDVLVYQVSDKYDANHMDHATKGDLIRSMHEELLDRADIVYYSGRKLFEEAERGRGYGTLKLARERSACCAFSIEKAHESPEFHCRNRRFADFPETGPDAITAFDLRHGLASS